jgi:3-oxoacyl-[acyl-carrier protein] reductase
VADSTRLDGQVAIVTGAAQGIGRGIALVLSEAGARIVIGDIQDASRTVGEVRADGGAAISMIMDTSSPNDARSLVDLALSEYGRLDLLVNNAGIDVPDGNAWDLPDGEWQRTIDVNLSGVFYCSRAALEPMLKVGKGCIVNISSQSARAGAKGLSPAYNASKAGVLGLTMAFSAQVADLGVRVNAILPSIVASRDFGRSTDPNSAPIAVSLFKERETAMLAQTASEYPLGLGTPRDVAEAVRYLASPAAKWVSGTELRLTGGYQL